MTGKREIADHLQFYKELGIAGVSKDAAWRDRADGAPPQIGDDRPPGQQAAATPQEGTTTPSDIPAGAGDPVAALAGLRSHIGPQCTRCKLGGLGRRQTVFGVGNPAAQLMFVGEAPGADEDIQGEPFVGKAGQLLTKIIEAMGFAREDVYIANVLKCRPPGNRAPEPDEVATCEPFLFSQIDTIRPRVIVALGAHAAHALLKVDTPISRIRGVVHDFRNGSKLIPTFHPAFLLRSPERKRDVWEDMKKVRAILAG